MIHQYWINDYGVKLIDIKNSGRNGNNEINVRNVESVLDKVFDISEKGIHEKREPIERIVGNCRFYALLLVSALRHKGIPARVRGGAALYFYTDKVFLEDHLITEFWNEVEERWQQVDPQLDEYMVKKCGIKFDVTDLPQGQFLNGGEVHMALRDEKYEPVQMGWENFGGYKFARFKIYQDMASVCGVEVLPFESWGLVKKKVILTKYEEKLMDRVSKALAELGNDWEVFEHLMEMFQSQPNLRIPADYEPEFFEFPFFK